MSLGEQIRKRRSELDMTQEQLADKLFVSRSTVSNWEINRNYPDIKLLISLSDALGISLDSLLKENHNVVDSIAYDTNEKKKNAKLVKMLKILVVVLFISLLSVLFIFTKDVDVSAGRILDITEEENNLIINLDLPFYRSAESYYIDYENEGKTANITIGAEYSFKHNEVIEIPLSEIKNAESVIVKSPDGLSESYNINKLH